MPVLGTIVTTSTVVVVGISFVCRDVRNDDEALLRINSIPDYYREILVTGGPYT